MARSQESIGNSNLRLTATNYGARLVTLEVLKDKTWIPVCAGFENLALYERADLQYFGATVGRVAGRLPMGKYRQDGLDLQLETNENGNHLHGGVQGAIHHQDWQVLLHDDEAITYGLISDDMAGGFPGNLKIRAEYRLEGSKLIMTLEAETDSKTPVNLTNHTYWNLSGNSKPAAEHELQIIADHVIPVDSQLLPTGREKSVGGTLMDFTRMRKIGKLGEASGEPEPGFDHTYLLRKGNGLRHAATLSHPDSGIAMKVETDAPALQLYTGNRNLNVEAALGLKVTQGNTICLETFGVNNPEIVGDYKTITLNPGENFSYTTIHTFTVG